MHVVVGVAICGVVRVIVYYMAAYISIDEVVMNVTIYMMVSSIAMDVTMYVVENIVIVHNSGVMVYIVRPM